MKFHVSTILMISMVAATSCVHAVDDLDVETLKEIANKVHSFTPKDEFDQGPPIQNLSGRQFSVTVAPLPRGPHNKIYSGYPSWAYWSDDNHYEVAYIPGMDVAANLKPNFGAGFPTVEGDFGAFIYYTSFSCTRSGDRYYVAQNAFGAETPVHKTNDKILAFSDVHDGEALHGWQIHATGDDARALSKWVRIRMTGTLGVWPNGQSVICATGGRSPTFDLPDDDNLDACIFKTTKMRFEVINGQTGEILHDE